MGAIIGEELEYGREMIILHNPYVMGVLKRRQIMGHVPRNVSRACSVFMRGNMLGVSLFSVTLAGTLSQSNLKPRKPQNFTH